MRHASALLAMAFAAGLLGSLARADTLTLRGPVDATLTLNVANGDVWTCTTPSLTIAGQFGRSGPMTITSASGSATSCRQLSAAPVPGTGSAAFSAATYSASAAIGRTFVTVTRVGPTAGALHVQWSATGAVTPAAGDLYWQAGDGGPRFVLLMFNAPTISTLTLPGARATLTVLH